MQTIEHALTIEVNAATARIVARAQLGTDAHEIRRRLLVQSGGQMNRRAVSADDMRGIADQLEKIRQVP